MDSSEKFEENTLPPKKYIYHISYYDYEHGKKVCDVFEIKNLGEYHNSYVQTDTLLLTDVFENFRNKCIKKYELDPLHFVSAPGLVWQVRLKKTWCRIRIIN